MTLKERQAASMMTATNELMNDDRIVHGGSMSIELPIVNKKRAEYRENFVV